MAYQLLAEFVGTMFVRTIANLTIAFLVGTLIGAERR